MDIIIKVLDINGVEIKEFIAIARYHKGRYFADAKITAGTRGLILTPLKTALIMWNIIKIMMKNDLLIVGVKVGQGINVSFIADIQGGYLVNPATNLKILAVIFTEVLILQRIRQLHSMRVPIGSHWDCKQMF
jgi:hypothetical protein